MAYSNQTIQALVCLEYGPLHTTKTSQRRICHAIEKVKDLQIQGIVLSDFNGLPNSLPGSKGALVVQTRYNGLSLNNADLKSRITSQTFFFWWEL
ncbi:hypothetical protein H4Q26_012352 [Puccinia striiformis f. sp. tritici PST-130]|nr:hypothetical protein H4Q26_012352 [Puccinia striiformis f. sp. tritici PST-130]